MKTEDLIDEARLNAFAETWGPAVQAVSSGEPSPETLARIHALAARGLRTRRQRVFLARIRPFLVSAAAASIVGAATLLALRTPEKTEPVHPLVTLDGVLMLAMAMDTDWEEELVVMHPISTDIEALTRRMLDLQGFVDGDTENSDEI
ncbi:MAG: hypothetical protein FJ222_00170 [Lentisphaerae bacterium]|nr:hypothetical protein [Lentisphaerota bacterium]